jgi:hypothetical protein
MSRTTLCVLTAAGLAALSLGVMVLRSQVLGDEVKAPAGPGTYKVTVVVRGKSAGEARLITACPLDFKRQHVCNEQCQSAELTPRHTEARRGERRQVQWAQKSGGKGPFQARYEFFCRVDMRPTASMNRLAEALYARPRAGEYVTAEPRIEPGHADICNVALDQTGGLERPADQARALFQFVDHEISNDPSTGGPAQSAVECLQSGRGDAAAQSRLLVALCRNRGIPARLVTGLMLSRRGEQKAHVWAEAWVGDYWVPMCPFHHHCGRVPPTYLVFGFGDMTLARGQNVRGLDYACLAEPRPLPGQEAPAEAPSLLRSTFLALSFQRLPPAERKLAEFLLLLPVAALIICVFRNLIGVGSFGTFAPALVGMAFRDLQSLPGLLVFVSIVLIGWGMRRALDRYHLLQVPRTAFLLSLVIVVLLSAILLANFQQLAVTRYFSLFPMVILTGMIERFWTLESEDGTSSSFRTLLGTMFIAGCISLVLSLPAVVGQMWRYPETLGLVMAAQLLLGRYTGYRLTELFRFRDFLGGQPPRMEAATSGAAPVTLKIAEVEAVSACPAE